MLSLLEEQDRLGHIDLFYADEVKFAEAGYVPYGWQFSAEDLAIEATRGKSINCFGFLKRNNEFFCKITQDNICLLYTSPSPRDITPSRMPSSA